MSDEDKRKARALPVHQAQELSSKHGRTMSMEDKKGNIKATKGTILIIDDELSPRESIRMVLSGEHNCLLAEDGENGLELLEQNPIDLIILDIKMPGIDGIETLRRIRAVNPNVVVVLLTAYGTLGTAQNGIRLGAFDYLTKPFDIQELREVVRRGLEKKSRQESEKAHVDDLEKIIDRMQHEMSNFDRMSKLGSLSAGIVHEMKNPLTVILGYTQMILSSIKDGGNDDDVKLSGKSLQYLNVIEKETMHCADIARKLLTVSKASQDEFTKTDIHEIIDNTEVLIQPQCSINQITLKKELADGPIYSSVIQNNIHDILLNLCINAIHATGKSGLISLRSVVTDKLGNGLADITGEERRYLNQQISEKFVAIEVQDSGCGVPEELRERIFEPFFTTKEGQFGTGLGLSVSREKAEKNHGKLSLVHTGPKGTTFRLLLPIT